MNFRQAGVFYYIFTTQEFEFSAASLGAGWLSLWPESEPVCLSLCHAVIFPCCLIRNQLLDLRPLWLPSFKSCGDFVSHYGLEYLWTVKGAEGLGYFCEKGYLDQLRDSQLFSAAVLYCISDPSPLVSRYYAGVHLHVLVASQPMYLQFHVTYGIPQVSLMNLHTQARAPIRFNRSWSKFKELKVL